MEIYIYKKIAKIILNSQKKSPKPKQNKKLMEVSLLKISSYTRA